MGKKIYIWLHIGNGSNIHYHESYSYEENTLNDRIITEFLADGKIFST